MSGVPAFREGPRNSPEQLCRSRVEFRLRLWNDNDLRSLKRQTACRPDRRKYRRSRMPEVGGVEIGIVDTEARLFRLLPLMRGYCDFYRVQPSDPALLSMARSLMADPTHEGVQLIA